MKWSGTHAVLVLVGATAILCLTEARAQSDSGASYLAARSRGGDSVAQLLQRIASKEVTLTGSDREILRTVLHELRVPVESQLAVFSRTSMQARLIGPTSPRVLYFSESTYVGWVPGGLIEVAAIDPDKGAQFYAFDPQDGRDRRRTLVRETSCLRCHGDGMTDPSPTLFARSIITTKDGEPWRERGFEFVTEQTPFEHRWGGWYVTGYDGALSHRGNAFGRERAGQLDFSPSEKRPVQLSEFFETSRYLAATSDVVALLVFEHQMAVQNTLLRVGQNVRRILNTQSGDQAAKLETALAQGAGEVLDCLLFRGAAPLSDGVRGHAAFARAFRAEGPLTRQGHSLRDLSLRGRLFENRCSYLIYSELFQALPAPLKERVFERLAAALHDEDSHGRYAYLAKDERQRIRDVLDETLPEVRLHLSMHLRR